MKQVVIKKGTVVVYKVEANETVKAIEIFNPVVGILDSRVYYESGRYIPTRGFLQAGMTVDGLSVDDLYPHQVVFEVNGSYYSQDGMEVVYEREADLSDIKKEIETSYMETRKKLLPITIKNNLLNYLQGEITSFEKDKGREITQAEVIQIINKTLKGVRDTIKLKSTEKALEEQKILLGLLPPQLSKDEIVNIMDANQLLNMKDVMNYLRTNHFGCYDPALVQSIFK